MASVDVVLPVLIFLAALLYSSVGHAGASGYLAAMALCGIAPAQMKPAALVLNILVAVIGTIQFVRAGHFQWRLLWPFVIMSIPCAYLGGRVDLAPHIYRPIVAVVLIASAIRMAWIVRRADDVGPPPTLRVALPVGALLGLVSGLTGVGGGIFLSPLFIFCRWAGTKGTAAVSVTFILVNSIAGLLGHAGASRSLPPHLATWAVAAVAGGAIGSWLGSRRAAPPVLRGLLVAVLVVAGGKLLFS